MVLFLRESIYLFSFHSHFPQRFSLITHPILSSGLCHRYLNGPHSPPWPIIINNSAIVQTIATVTTSPNNLALFLIHCVQMIAIISCVCVFRRSFRPHQFKRASLFRCKLIAHRNQSNWLEFHPPPPPPRPPSKLLLHIRPTTTDPSSAANFGHVFY